MDDELGLKKALGTELAHNLVPVVKTALLIADFDADKARHFVDRWVTDTFELVIADQQEHYPHLPNFIAAMKGKQ